MDGDELTASDVAKVRRARHSVLEELLRDRGDAELRRILAERTGNPLASPQPGQGVIEAILEIEFPPLA